MAHVLLGRNTTGNKSYCRSPTQYYIRSYYTIIFCFHFDVKNKTYITYNRGCLRQIKKNG